jgi:hypothetical protein
LVFSFFSFSPRSHNKKNQSTSEISVVFLPTLQQVGRNY